MNRALLMKMRGLGAMMVLDHLLVAGAFQTLPISSNTRHGNPTNAARHRHVLNKPSCAAFHLGATRDAMTDAEEVPANKPVLSFPGGGIFFWVRACVFERLWCQPLSIY